MPTSRHRIAVLAAATAAVSALLLTACDPGTPSSGGHHSRHHGVSKSHTSHGSQDTQGSDSSDAAADTSDAVNIGTAAAHTTAPGVQRCHTPGLAVSFETGGDAAPDPAADTQQTTGIALRNTGNRPCVIGGFPGLDLVGGSTTWPLVRQSARHGSITLLPGDTTDFTITFLPDPKGPWTPATVTVTPPNETASVTLAWPWGPVLLQDGATHPGTYVGPIG